jgi:hypothetical protein
MKHDVAILEKLQCYTNLFTKLKLTSLAIDSHYYKTPLSKRGVFNCSNGHFVIRCSSGYSVISPNRLSLLCLSVATSMDDITFLPIAIMTIW